jgi:hypothetical protein
LEKVGKKLLVKGMCEFCARKSGCDLIRLGLSVLAV